MDLKQILLIAIVVSLANGQAFRDDYRCGNGYPAPNGQSAAECDPEGPYPCCSPYNWCGITSDHCECEGCVDYRPYRQDYRCGPGYPAGNGEDAECDPNGPYPCCSPYNWCGITSDHCDCEDCIDYRPYRQDYRCGSGYPAGNGEDAECDPDGPYPCCSPYNWCGITSDHCDCEDCIDYRPYRQDYRCGPGYPAGNGEDAECDSDGPYPCCSPYNWCGITSDHCDCEGCIDYRPAYREDYRCGPGYVAPNGEEAQCNPKGIYPCCSPYNWCGNTADHCDCPDCVDYRYID